MEIQQPGTQEVFLNSEVYQDCQLSKIKVKKGKKKWFLFHKFEAYKLSLPEELLKIFLLQQKKAVSFKKLERL